MNSRNTPHPPARPVYSIVIPCFQEEGAIRLFHERLCRTVDAFERPVEIIYVNDGSRDGTLPLLQEIFEEDPRVTHLVDLARNVGQTCALTAGIVCATGDHFIFMDCDLQMNSDDLGRLIAAFEEGHDLAGGYRARRRDTRLRVWLSRLGNRILSRVVGIDLRDLGCSFKIIDGALLRAHQFGPNRPLNPGEIILSLRSVAEIEIEHRPRRHGRSRWTIGRVLALYHNVLRNLVPLFYPVLAVGLLLSVVLISAYLGIAWTLPQRIAPPPAGPLTAGLVLLNVLITVVFFLIIGQSIMSEQSEARALAYVVREHRSRPFASEAQRSNTAAFSAADEA